MIKITEEFIKKLEIYKEINLHSNMGWTVTPGDQEQSTAAGLENIRLNCIWKNQHQGKRSVF